MLPLDQRLIRRSKRWDRLARWVITLGGVTVIASVIAILLLIVGVTLPLFLPARAELAAEFPKGKIDLPQKVLSLGVRLDLDQQDRAKSLTVDFLSADGTFEFLNLTPSANVDNEKTAAANSSAPGNAEPPLLNKEKIISPASKDATIIYCERSEGSKYTLLWSDGSVSLVDLLNTTDFVKGGARSVKYDVINRATIPAEKDSPAAAKALGRYTKDESGSTAVICVRLLSNNRLMMSRTSKIVNEMLGNEEEKTQRTEINDQPPGPISTITMDKSGHMLYAGTENGCLMRWRFDDHGKVIFRETVRAFRDQRPITALAMVFGDVSLAVGDSRGNLTVWSEVRDSEDAPHLRQIHELSKHDAAVVEIVASPQEKTLLSRSADGDLHVDYPTSEKMLLSFPAEKSLSAIGMDPRGTALATLDDKNILKIWRVNQGYPEVSFKTLFGKVFYEGYNAPALVWQTTGSQDSEPKLSLVPLVFGTLKGTAYAMIFAVPIALFAAAYTSHFTTPGLKKFIKPIVEIMAALPSVVLGFLAALWFAPLLEHWIPGVFACFMTLPLVFLAFMVLWQILRKYDWAKHVEHGYEFIVMLPVLLLGIGSGMYLVSDSMRSTFGHNLNTWLFNGNFLQWLNSALRMPYDQRNCVIISFGLGFAVIPIIFSIAEDSLSNVPHSLNAASMAMGASRWQTLWRINLPSASPGIFAGAMIGFGRAVGETMIVLMATGNTPILDWSPFNGMRTLSANIAVEIPEAPVGGTLYRVLFLCAVILFLLTFVLNTAAELVRTRLRKRYGQF